MSLVHIIGCLLPHSVPCFTGMHKDSFRSLLYQLFHVVPGQVPQERWAWVARLFSNIAYSDDPHRPTPVLVLLRQQAKNLSGALEFGAMHNACNDGHDNADTGSFT